MSTNVFARVAWGFVCATSIGACGGGSPTFPGPEAVGPAGLTVGAPCTADTQCTTKCIRSTCSSTCASDVDCPPGTACVNSDGGMCAYLCSASAQCASGQVCEAEDRKGAGGKASVCRRP